LKKKGELILLWRVEGKSQGSAAPDRGDRTGKARAEGIGPNRRTANNPRQWAGCGGEEKKVRKQKHKFGVGSAGLVLTERAPGGEKNSQS